jgi:hypothetical protein
MAKSSAARGEERAEWTQEIGELALAMAEERGDVAEQIVELAGEILKIAESRAKRGRK